MTDLEDAWNRYPDSPAPIAEIVREGGRNRRTQFVKPAFGGLVAAGVAIALAVSLNSGGGGDLRGSTASVPAKPGLRVVAFRADLKPARSCGDLLSAYRSRGAKSVGAWGWSYWGFIDGVNFSGDGGPVALTGTLAMSSVAAQASTEKSFAGQGNSSTGTNVQEVGVDEPDTVKTNGTLLARIDGNTIAVYDVTGSEPKRVSTIALPYFGAGQILLSGNTVVAIGSNTAPGAGRMNARVTTVSLAHSADPTITSNATYSGYVSSARQQGSTIRLVLTTGLPNLHFVHPSKTRSVQRAILTNRQIVNSSTLAQWLPGMDLGSGVHPLLDCQNVAVTPASVQLGTTSVIGFNVSAPTSVSAIGLSGQTTTAYESTGHLYLTSNGTQLGYCSCVMPAMGRPSSRSRTAIFAFDLIGDQAAHVATGTVNGFIKDRYSMDEVNGVLRVATSQYVGSTQTSSVITLKQSGAALKQVGRLDGLGKGETLTAARWFDDFAVLSTARQIDPLFTVDLTNPAHPRVLGALHIPGFSSYFHPLGNGLLLGVGQNVSFNGSDEHSRAQVGLFDIANLAKVKRLAVSTLAPWSYPLVSYDTHTFTWLPDHDVALTFFSGAGNGIQLGEFTVKGQHLTTKLVSVPAGDPSKVRTFELPNGKVVLMAGGTVSFLKL